MPKKQYPFFENAFALKIPAEYYQKIDMHACSEEENKAYNASLQSWQANASKVVIDPKNYDESLVTHLVFGTLLSDESLTAETEAEFARLPGSSAIGHSKETIRSTFFSNTISGDPRINMHYVNKGLADARRKTQEMLSGDDREAMAKTLGGAVRLYADVMQRYGNIQQDDKMWRESVFRLNDLMRSAEKSGFEPAEIGIDERLKNKIGVCSQLADLLDERATIKTELEKMDQNAVLTGEDRKKLIRYQAISALEHRFRDEYKAVDDSYAVTALLQNKNTDNLDEAHRRANKAPLFPIEKKVLSTERGAKSLADDLEKKVAQENKEKDLHAGDFTKILYKPEEVAYDMNATWQGILSAKDVVWNTVKGMREDIDRNADTIRDLAGKFADDPENVEFDDVLRMKTAVSSIQDAGVTFSNYSGYEPDDPKLPSYLEVRNGLHFYQGKQIDRVYANVDYGDYLGAFGPLDTAIRKFDTNQMKNAPKLTSMQEFLRQSVKMTAELEKNAPEIPGKPAVLKNLLSALKRLPADPAVHSERFADAAMNVVKCAVKYEEEAKDLPNAGKALETCRSIIRGCGSMSFRRNIDAARALDVSNRRQIFREGIPAPKDYSFSDMFNGLKEVSLIYKGSDEFKALSDSIKDVMGTIKKMSVKDPATGKMKIRTDAAGIRKLKDQMAKVSEAAGKYTDKKEIEDGGKYRQAGTRDNARYNFAMDVLGFSNKMERQLIDAMVSASERESALRENAPAPQRNEPHPEENGRLP